VLLVLVAAAAVRHDLHSSDLKPHGRHERQLINRAESAVADVQPSLASAELLECRR